MGTWRGYITPKIYLFQIPTGHAIVYDSNALLALDRLGVAGAILLNEIEIPKLPIIMYKWGD